MEGERRDRRRGNGRKMGAGEAGDKRMKGRKGRRGEKGRD